MFEIVILLVGALPFIVGLYAIKIIRDSEMGDGDDPPPPPDPEPPTPILPPTPEPRRLKKPSFAFDDHRPVRRQHFSSPHWHRRVKRS